MDCAGAIYAVACREREELVTVRQGGSFPKSRYSTARNQTVFRWTPDGEIARTDIRDDLIPSYVQPYPGGVLLVGARCQWTRSGAQHNALALGWNGEVLDRFALGDGIQDVRTTPDRATIWVSYFDEGVFGNRGWANPGPPPMGADGLVAYSSTGEVRRRYDADEAGTDIIADAYAMNVVDDDEAWVYFYTEFPLVRIRHDGYRVWPLSVRGAQAFAVRGNRALMYGDYSLRGLARVVELDERGRATVAESAFVVDEEGRPLDEALTYGVGSRLYFFRDHRVWMLSDW